MPKAARLGDSIGHTPPGDGPIGGIGDVTGKIVGPCSSNVFTNGIKAARAYVDVVVCALHPQAPLPIATGSSTVFINGLPAARVSDKIVCRAYITDGSANVFIGGAAVQTNSFMPEGIFEEVVELVENGATLVLGAGEIVVGGFYNSVVRIGAGLASIPYMLDSVDAAVGVQKEIAEGLNYNFRSDGAKQIGEALKPVGAYVQEKITVAKDFSEEHIGLGATAVVFGSAEAVVEIAGVVSGGKVVKSFIDFPLPGANSSTAAVANGNISPQNPLNADSISRNPNRNLVKQVGPTCGHNSCGMVLNTLGKSVDIGDLIKKIPPGKDGIYSRDVATLLKSEGIDAVALGRRNVSAP